jgi:glycosyltransferase involved in cell wall biosynthesis
LNDTIRNGETGWQVPLGDAAALADAIVDILDGAEEAARRTRVGAAAVERSYDRRLVFETFVNRLAGEVKGHHLPG